MMSATTSSTLFPPNDVCIVQSDENVSSYWEELSVSSNSRYLGLFTLSLIFICGVPLNLYILILLIHKKLYSHPTFLLLINLTFSDLFTCLIPLLYSIIARIAGQASFGSTDYIRCQVCKIGGSFILLSLVSTFTIALLSLDRLLFFKETIYYENFVNTRRIAVVLVIIWVLSTALTLPPLLDYGGIVFTFYCGPAFVTPLHIRRGMIYTIVSGCVVVSVSTVIVVANVGILILAVRVIKKRKKTSVRPRFRYSESSFGGPNDYQKNVKKMERLIQNRAVAKRQVRLLQTFGAIIIVNIFTTLPIVALAVVVIFTANIPVWYVVFVQFWIFSRTTLHPLMQILNMAELRQHLKYCKTPKKLKKMWDQFCSCCINNLWAKELEIQLRNKLDSPSLGWTAETS